MNTGEFYSAMKSRIVSYARGRNRDHHAEKIKPDPTKMNGIFSFVCGTYNVNAHTQHTHQRMCIRRLEANWEEEMGSQEGIGEGDKG